MRLDPWHIDFVQQEVVISLASQDGDGRPSIARAAGCRPSADGRVLRLIVPAPASRQFLADIEATGRVAVVFSRPTTFHTIQVKGRDAHRVPAAAGDSECAEAFLTGLARELTRVGDPPSLVEARLGFDPASLAVVEFTIDALFLQTPGPAAGERLKPLT